MAGDRADKAAQDRAGGRRRGTPEATWLMRVTMPQSAQRLLVVLL